ncbi:MAG: HD domain-containing protein [Nitrospinae bacterium]|nr:HD domain-containing protein [Nitrospinota bacterium]
MAKDLVWIIKMDIDDLPAARVSVLKELVFVCLVILGEIANLIVSYSRNLRRFFACQNGALTAVADGDLKSRVPVSSNDEFGVMARYTNKMIRDLDERNRELRETQLEIVRRLGRAAEYRDNETGYHVIRMSLYSESLGKALGMSEKECETLRFASPMHDVGKIGIPDNILLKPGKLDEREWKIMKTHAAIGAEILKGSRSELLKMAEAIALTHQEKWDGSGYPNGLAGEDIPVVGRITAVCDVFDALTSERPYKRAWSVEEAVDYIETQSGKHFDPRLVPLFKSVLPEILENKAKYRENQGH